MDLSSLKVDSAALDAGVWIDAIPDLGDIRLKVRDPASTAVAALRLKYLRAVAFGDKQPDGSLKPDVADSINARVMAEAVLVDWKNVTEGDKPVPFSPAQALTYLTDPDFRVFTDGVAWAAGRAQAAAMIGAETTAKN